MERKGFQMWLELSYLGHEASLKLNCHSSKATVTMVGCSVSRMAKVRNSTYEIHYQQKIEDTVAPFSGGEMGCARLILWTGRCPVEFLSDHQMQLFFRSKVEVKARPASIALWFF